MIRLVLFDIDGTLIRTGGAGVTAFARVVEHVYGRPGATQALRFHGATDSGLVTQLFQIMGCADTPAERAHFFAAYVFWLDQLLQQHRGEVCRGVDRCLDGLRQRAEPPLLGLLTGNIRLGAELKLRAHGLWEAFGLGAFGDEHPDRGEIAKIAQTRGSQCLGCRLNGSEILVIGDTPADVACGRVIGARCLAVATGGYDEESLRRSRPDWCVADLDQLDLDKICS